MRLSVAIAVACLSVTGLSVADPSQAAIRRATSIGPQGLAPALQRFAKETGIQVVYKSDLVGDRQTSGAVGELTVEETLKKLLSGTGLTFQYLEDTGVTIVPISAGSAARQLSQGNSPSPGAGEGLEVRTAQSTKASPPAMGGSAPKGADEERATIDEIVVTAQKRTERLLEVPISISVMRGEDLDKSPVQSVNEMLNRVPGVVVSTAGVQGGTQVSIRGVTAGGLSFNGSSPNAYYLDSVPFGFIRSAYAPDSNVYDLQRVEVLRGPQGTLYGASAAAGVVRVLTNDPDLNNFDLKARTYGSVTDGGSENYDGDVAINIPIIPGGLAARAVVDYQSLGGWIDRPGNRNANDAKLHTYRLKLEGQPTDQLSIGASAWISRNRFGAPSVSDDAGFSGGTTPAPIHTDYDVYALKASYDLSGYSVTGTTSYLSFSDSFVFDFGVPPLNSFGSPIPLALDARLDSRVFSQEVNLASSTDGPWKWTAGAIYRDVKDKNFQINRLIDNDTNPVIGASELNWTDTSKSYAVFGEISQRFYDEKLEWTLGIRQFHDRVASKKNVAAPPPYDKSGSFNATTPRAVLSWFPVRNLTFYGTYSEGFRSGMPQYYAIAQAGPFSLPDLKPDKIHNYEVGMKADFLDRRLSVDAAIYYIKWKDVQQNINIPYPNNQPGFIAAQVNGASVSGPGFEYSVAARPIDSLQLGVSFGWNDLTFDKEVLDGGVVLFNKGDRLQESSKYTAGASADYTFPLGDFTGQLSTSANYTSKQYVRSPGSVQVGDKQMFARTSLSLRSRQHWTVALFVENLTNENNSLTGRVYSVVDQWIPRPRPRTVGLQLDYSIK